MTECRKCGCLAWRHIGGVPSCVLCETAWQARCDDVDDAIDAAEHDLRVHPATGGRHVYSETLLPPPSDDAERVLREVLGRHHAPDEPSDECERYLRAATAPRKPKRGLLARVRGAWRGLREWWRE